MAEALLMILFWMLVGLLVFCFLIFCACLVKAYDRTKEERIYYTERPPEPDKEALKVLPQYRLSRKEFNRLIKAHQVPRGYRWMRYDY